MAKTNINRWIEKAELDYYTMFIKAWIPFNAWYCVEYNTKKDDVALKEIKTTRNVVRNRIEALLQNNDIDAKNFRYTLAQLHFQLENRSIMNYGKKISFRSIVLDDYFPPPSTDTDRVGNVYKAIPHKTTGYKAIIVAKNGRTLMDKTFNPYDVNALLTETQYIALADVQKQARIKACFESINPNKPIDLVSTSKIKSEHIILDGGTTKFISDTETIAKALIGILYELRCILFHGIIDPTETNQPIYEHAYHLLKPIINELK